jgi:hypothetical protein
MRLTPMLALGAPDAFPGELFMALTLTAAILLPAGFLFALLREKMAAKIPKKRPSLDHL